MLRAGVVEPDISPAPQHLHTPRRTPRPADQIALLLTVTKLCRRSGGSRSSGLRAHVVNGSCCWLNLSEKPSLASALAAVRGVKSPIACYRFGHREPPEQ